MFLKSLILQDFRNYSEFNQNFDKLKTIIIGQNAQGKSNILEAINILATSKSNRAERDCDLVNWNKDFALIFASVEKNDDLLSIALQINNSGRRKLKINGVMKRAPQADLLGNFFSVMFSSEDLYLIKGSPSLRRDWIDGILLQLEEKYSKNLNSYQKALTQKNALLKSFKEGKISLKGLKDQLDIWNDQIIQFGVEIVLLRLNFIEEILPIAVNFLQNISKNKEELKVNYKSLIYTEGKNIKDTFKEKLTISFDEECARAQSVCGPHRDDLEFFINDKLAKSFASQGQQRSIVLALKLAELKIIEKRKNEIPVLLLDDVFAELDESRQDFLLHNLPPNIQTFITTTHISELQHELLENALVLKIENGKVLVNA